MILLTIRDKKHLFQNSVEDDFLRFIPNRFACTPNEIKIEVVAEGDLLRCRQLNLDRSGADVQIGVVFEIGLLNGVLGLLKTEPPSLKPGDIDPSVEVSEDEAPVLVDASDPRCGFQKVLVSAVSTLEADGWPYSGDVFTGIRVK